MFLLKSSDENRLHNTAPNLSVYMFVFCSFLFIFTPAASSFIKLNVNSFSLSRRLLFASLLNSLCFLAVVLPFPSQMGGASSYSTQFLSHSGPRGPPGMNPGGMVPSRPGPPPSAGSLYPSHPAQTQKMGQHGGYPGGQQGLKRPFHSEVSDGNISFIILKIQK